jgi:hypothetical protein
MFSKSIDTSYREKDQVSLALRLIGLALSIFICPLFFFTQITFAEIKVIKTEPFTIADDAVDNGYMSMKADCDSVNNRCLVVWNKNSDIYGQFINKDGTLHGERIPIVMATGSVEQLSPGVAFDPEHYRYLVTYSSNLNSWWRTYCQFVNADGSLQGTPFILVDCFNSLGEWICPVEGFSGQVKYDPINHRFAVIAPSSSMWSATNLYSGSLSLDGGSILGRLNRSRTIARFSVPHYEGSFSDSPIEGGRGVFP